jgi:hypothetical protein
LKRWNKFGAIVILLSAWAQVASAQDSPAAVKDFDARLTKYLELRKDETGDPQKPSKSPEQITNNEQQIAAKMRAARAGAKQGDIFTPQITAFFRQQIAKAMEGHKGERVEKSMQRAEPVDGLKLQVNDTYPSGVPLQSTPPTLLLKLPALPSELEYRIVGQNLVLHDIAANLVVDFIPNAMP